MFDDETTVEEPTEEAGTEESAEVSSDSDSEPAGAVV